MTANRWWVKLAARWLARIDGVQGQVRMISLAVTAFSTFSIMLQGFGLGRYVPYVAVFGVLMGTVYTYYYNEGGVRNQVQRDRADLATNFAGPSNKIDDTLIGAAVFGAVHGRPPDDEELDAIKDSVDKPWREFRQGINLDDATASRGPDRGGQQIQTND
jgi:hypothetical protein